MHHVEDRASLENLHDIVVPEALSTWWPPAPGWWVIIVAVSIVVVVLLVRWLAIYYRNAYRRYALRLLREAIGGEAISVILKRVALAAYPREEVAALSGDAWVDWLRARADCAMPGSVTAALRAGVYQPAAPERDLSVFRTFAGEWIRKHKTYPSIGIEQ